MTTCSVVICFERIEIFFLREMTRVFHVKYNILRNKEITKPFYLYLLYKAHIINEVTGITHRIKILYVNMSETQIMFKIMFTNKIVSSPFSFSFVELYFMSSKYFTMDTHLYFVTSFRQKNIVIFLNFFCLFSKLILHFILCHN